MTYAVIKNLNGVFTVVHTGSMQSLETYFENRKVSIELVFAKKHGIYSIQELDGE